MDRYAIIGNPVDHSKSPRIHALFAEQTAQNIAYGAICAPLDGFGETAREFFAHGGRGLNVTVPFKQQAFEIATELSARARVAAAVNTLALNDATLFGDNTDGVGLVKDIEDNLG
ncbi:MAG: shikimate dehydrogenase, partial [Methylococcales bacterium]